MDHRVLVDANVLYSRTLRDWLLLLNGDDDAERVLTVCWTEDILAEVVYRLRRRHPTLSGTRHGRPRVPHPRGAGRRAVPGVDP